MNHYSIKGYKRITKSIARKLWNSNWNSNTELVLCPCKLMPFTEWHNERIVTMQDHEMEHSFDAMVNNFTYYNCQYNETGYYPSFYMKELQ